MIACAVPKGHEELEGRLERCIYHSGRGSFRVGNMSATYHELWNRWTLFFLSSQAFHSTVSCSLAN